MPHWYFFQGAIKEESPCNRRRVSRSDCCSGHYQIVLKPFLCKSPFFFRLWYWFWFRSESTSRRSRTAGCTSASVSAGPTTSSWPSFSPPSHLSVALVVNGDKVVCLRELSTGLISLPFISLLHPLRPPDEMKQTAMTVWREQMGIPPVASTLPYTL